MNGVKQELDKIDRSCQGSQSMVKDFEAINSVSKCHINFLQTLEMVDNLENMQNTLDVLQEQLTEDQADKQQSSPNLLMMHFQLSKLLEFRDAALQQSTRARKDVQDTLRRYFIPLEKFSAEFEAHLLELSTILLDTLRSGDPSLVVRIAKIVYLEETEDTKARTLQNAQKSQQAGTRAAKRSAAIAGDARLPRDYKAKFLDSIRGAIQEDFKGCSEAFEEPAELLENLDWIFQDLSLVQNELTIRTPKEWKIFDVFLEYYHENTYHLLNKILKLNPDGSTILKLLEWVKLYASTMKNDLGIDVKNLSPKLLDGKDNELIEDYLQLIVKKLDEWMAKLESTEMTSFIERTEQPEMSPEGIYGMQGAVIMFQMVSQQIDVAADSGQGRVLASVVGECVRAMGESQHHWLSVVNKEVEKVELYNPHGKVEMQEPVPGLPDYIIALANDQIRSADYCESISSRIAPLVSVKYKKPIVDGLSAATDGFLDLAKSCLTGLIRIINNDVQVVFHTLFTKEWYTSDQMSSIVHTTSEYIQDCRDHLNDVLLDLFLDELLDWFLIEYISAMCSNKKAFFKSAALTQLPSEIGIAFNLFHDNMDMAQLQSRFDVLELVIAFLQSDASTVLEDWHRVRETCWDTPVWVVEGILERREDISKKDVKVYMDVIRKDVGGQTDSNIGRVPTLMSRIKKMK